MFGLPGLRGPVVTEPTELVLLQLRVDEGRRGDIVEVAASRAAKLYRARAAIPAPAR